MLIDRQGIMNPRMSNRSQSKVFNQEVDDNCKFSSMLEIDELVYGSASMTSNNNDDNNNDNDGEEDDDRQINEFEEMIDDEFGDERNYDNNAPQYNNIPADIYHNNQEFQERSQYMCEQSHDMIAANDKERINIFKLDFLQAKSDDNSNNDLKDPVKFCMSTSSGSTDDDNDDDDDDNNDYYYRNSTGEFDVDMEQANNNTLRRVFSQTDGMDCISESSDSPSLEAKSNLEHHRNHVQVIDVVHNQDNDAKAQYQDQINRTSTNLSSFYPQDQVLKMDSQFQQNRGRPNGNFDFETKKNQWNTPEKKIDRNIYAKKRQICEFPSKFEKSSNDEPTAGYTDVSDQVNKNEQLAAIINESLNNSINSLVFVCSYCLNYKTKRRYSLVHHIKKHLNINHLMCNKCSYSTVRVGDMRRHIRQVHVKRL